MREESMKIIRNTYINFIKNYKSTLVFEMSYKLLVLIIFAPINAYVINKFITDMGLYNITNIDLVKKGLTIPGVITICIIAFIYFVAIFIEISVLTYIASQTRKNKDINVFRAMRNCIKLIPKNIGVYIIPMILVTGIIGPLVDVGLYSSIITDLTIPSFIKIELFKTTFGQVMFTLARVGLVIIFLRWVLSIPAIFIEKISLKEAFRNSVKIYNTNRKEVIYYVGVFVIINALIKRILIVTYMHVGALVINILGVSTNISGVFTLAYLVLFVIGYILVSIITLPIFINFLVEIYYKYRNYDVEERILDKEDSENKSYLFLDKHAKKIGILICILFSLVIFSKSKEIIFKNVIREEIKVTSHRGSSSAPENSMSSIYKAAYEGADYCEIDVMTTKDNHVVLFHDSTLKRIDNTNRRIKDMTLEEVKRVDNGSYFSKHYKGEKIPTLEEVLMFSKGKIKLNIELKPMKKNDTLAYEVSKLIKKYNMEDEVVISSIDYDSVQELKKYMPSVDVGYILTLGFGDLTKLDVDFVSVEYAMLSKSLVNSMHKLNKEVHVWTLNDDTRIMNAAKMGVDNIITDDIEKTDDILMRLNYRSNVFSIDLDTGEETRDEFIPYYEINYMNWFYHSVMDIIRHINI